MVLLGSDVTFDDEACAKLALLVARLLFVNGGVAFIASKRYYFGTNGGALEFQKRCEECGLTVHEASRSDMEGGMQHVILRIECLDLGGMLGKEIAVQQR
ncbi:hypothetical protein ERJ75_000022300 [Trypanosoma vivax]|nr:hypothetical protein ERJ75_000022300 [Trypanosoma vivax]